METRRLIADYAVRDDQRAAAGEANAKTGGLCDDQPVQVDFVRCGRADRHIRASGKAMALDIYCLGDLEFTVVRWVEDIDLTPGTNRIVGMLEREARRRDGAGIAVAPSGRHEHLIRLRLCRFSV
jgi:hypothetical protein